MNMKNFVAMTGTLAIAIMAIFSTADLLNAGNKPKAAGAAAPVGATCSSIQTGGIYTTQAVVQTASVNNADACPYAQAAIVRTATAGTCNAGKARGTAIQAAAYDCCASKVKGAVIQTADASE